jgi:hypothetical protein
MNAIKTRGVPGQEAIASNRSSLFPLSLRCGFGTIFTRAIRDDVQRIQVSPRK